MSEPKELVRLLMRLCKENITFDNALGYVNIFVSLIAAARSAAALEVLFSRL
jgi:hypothetical protein